MLHLKLRHKKHKCIQWYWTNCIWVFTIKITSTRYKKILFTLKTRSLLYNIKVKLNHTGKIRFSINNLIDILYMVFGKQWILIFILVITISELNIPGHVAITICFSFACKYTWSRISGQTRWCGISRFDVSPRRQKEMA